MAKGWGRPPGGRAGFTLVEILIIVALIGIIAMVAGPSLRRTRIAENESAAIRSLKFIVTAQERYKAGSPSRGYGNFQDLAISASWYVDRDLASGRKRGYVFTMTVGTPSDSSWYAIARPIEPGVTGRRHFFVDSSGVIRAGNRPQDASSGDSAPDE